MSAEEGMRDKNFELMCSTGLRTVSGNGARCVARESVVSGLLVMGTSPGAADMQTIKPRHKCVISIARQH